MRNSLIGLAFLAGFGPAAAGEIASAYTELDLGRDCAVVAVAGPDDGDWQDFVCSGWRGYPVLLSTADLRSSVFYGFPPTGNRPFETFAGFNSVGSRIEWRIETDGDRSTPFATIHRWTVDGAEGQRTEVLVVARIGQLDKREGCTVGLVAVPGNPGANEAARKLADERARSFACGTDRPVEVGRLPSFGGAAIGRQ
ncbi:hypothetical protein FFK22_035920 [Mycobacterium sp. KBS0706]|uniref:hypothetical protein n=1 Tax=Mycobacterium sp. KBS0706 TaxID=2578109 RepID=UPI00110F9DE8|nr:hypothetical protein [Mycobacterium sp. KBS0706]TSD83783.1 hypothetical protein FFK22_035920 [Mycobacterium sp. KBS0706]